MQIDQAQARALPGAVVYDPAHQRVGTVGHVWHDVTGQPAWAGVVTGPPGTAETLVPLLDARVADAALHTAYDRDRIAAAPPVDMGSEEVDVDRLRALYDYYGLVLQDGPRRSVPTGAADEVAVTRSEERLRVGTRTEVVEKVRLRKYVVTENVTVTVPVRREEIRLERVPVSEPDLDGDRILPAGAAGDEGVEIILHAERPVVTTEAVPVERVRFGKQTITERRTVTGEVRQERVEVDLPGRAAGQPES